MEFMSITTIAGLTDHETDGWFCIFFLQRAHSKVLQNLSEIGQIYSFSFHKKVKNPFFFFSDIERGKRKSDSACLCISTYI